MLTLSFRQADLLRCRFAVSPLWETTAAIRCLLYPRGRDAQLRCLREPPPASALRLGALGELQPEFGYVPDFLAPPPQRRSPSIDAELDQVLATPADQARAEMCRAFGRKASEPAIRELLDDPAATVAELAATLRRCWDTVLRPRWPQIQDVLDGDIAYRSRLLTDGGTEALLADLHPAVHWADGRIVIDAPSHYDRDLGGLGVLFMPSVFNAPRVNVYTDPPWQPSVIYPARGIAAAWPGAAARPAALAPLLGQTRAEILAMLTDPASTARVARHTGVSAPTASRHLHILLAAGLVTRNRVGHEVRYHRTELGDALLAGRR